MNTTWTEQKPETEGWYWISQGTSLCITRVRMDGSNGKLFCDLDDFPYVSDVSNALWAGPIPHPDEP